MCLRCKCLRWARGSVSLPNHPYLLSSGTPLCILPGLQLSWSQEASLGDKVTSWGVSYTPRCFTQLDVNVWARQLSCYPLCPREMTSPGALPKAENSICGHKGSARDRCLPALQGSVGTQTCQWLCGVSEARSWLRLSPSICSSSICTVLFYTWARECLTEIAPVETY